MNSKDLRELADKAWARGNKELSTDLHNAARHEEAREKGKMKIWLDDIRDAPDDTWKVVRLPQDALSLLTFAAVCKYPVEIMSFDHDLGEDINTGYDVLKSIEEDAARGDWDMVPLKMQIHSANPVGRKNMQAAIDSIERMRHGNV